MASLFRKKYASTADGKRVVKKAKKWYGKYVDELGTVKRLPLSPNRAAAEQMLNDLVKKVERRRSGLPVEDDVKALPSNRPLSEHLAAYEAALLAKPLPADHVRQVVTRVRAVVEGCGFVLPADIDVPPVLVLLTRLQGEKDRPALPAQEWFTPAELAALLGVSRAAVTQMVRRHGLHTTAAGKARSRKFPRSTAERLLELSARGLGSQTASYYWREFKAFCRWMATRKPKRLLENPLEGEKGPATRSDPRHDRRPLPPDQLRRLLDVTRQSVRTWRGLTGGDRWHLYLTACVTGYRRKELASLTPASFDLDGAPPLVTLPGKRTKNKKLAEQPLPADVADVLHGYLAGRDPGAVLWPRPCLKAIVVALRYDLEEAGIPYSIEGPEGPLFFDFHGLRHSYVLMVTQSGATYKEAMQLARHSTAELTVARYGRLQLNDLGAAVERLPSLVGCLSGHDAEPAALRATGTAGDVPGTPDLRPELRPKLRPTAAPEREQVIAGEQQHPPEGLSATPSEVMGLSAFEAPQDGMTSSDKISEKRGSPATAAGPLSWGRVGA